MENFHKKPNVHIRSKVGCPKCANLERIKTKTKTNNQFIKESILKHGDKYNYSLVNYISSESKVKIICKIHGIFEQLPNGHLEGKGCSDCGKSKNTKNNKTIYR